MVILSQALVTREGATTIPEGSTLKWVEAHDPVYTTGDDIVSSYVESISSLKDKDGSRVTTLSEDWSNDALAKTLKAIKLDVEKALVGVDQAAVPGSASAARKMASVSQQISTTVDAGSNSTDALTEAKLIELHQTCYTNGSEPTVLMIKPADATIVAGFATATGRNREIDAKTLINVIDVILTPFGELRTVINRNQLSTHAFLVDPSMFKQCVLRPFTRTLLAKNGDADTHFVVGEISNKHVNYSDSGMITGLS